MKHDSRFRSGAVRKHLIDDHRVGLRKPKLRMQDWLDRIHGNADPVLAWSRLDRYGAKRHSHDRLHLKSDAAASAQQASVTGFSSAFRNCSERSLGSASGSSPTESSTSFCWMPAAAADDRGRPRSRRSLGLSADSEVRATNRRPQRVKFRLSSGTDHPAAAIGPEECVQGRLRVIPLRD